MKITDELAQNLLFARDYIQKTIKKLDVHSGECTECHHKRYRNFSHFNIHKELSAVVRKLENFATNLQKESNEAGKVIMVNNASTKR